MNERIDNEEMKYHVKTYNDKLAEFKSIQNNATSSDRNRINDFNNRNNFDQREMVYKPRFIQKDRK
jgi:hypothetical protein